MILDTNSFVKSSELDWDSKSRLDPSISNRFNLLVLEPSASGHRMALYLRNILREAVQRGWKIHLITTDEALNHPAYQLVAEEIGDALTVSTLPQVEFPSGSTSRLRLFWFQISQHRAFKQVYKHCTSLGLQPDLVYVNELSSCDKAIALLGSPFGQTRMVGMLMGITFHHDPMGVASSRTHSHGLAKLIFNRFLRMRSLARLLVIDPLIVPYLRQIAARGESKVTYIPDVAQLRGSTTKEKARRRLTIEEKSFVILVYGSLDERKAIDVLLSGLNKVTTHLHTEVLIAGQVKDETTQLLLNGNKVSDLTLDRRFRWISGFIDDDCERDVFAAADVVWLGYRGFDGMSGVLLQAGLAGLPIIACQKGMVGWLTMKHGLGIILESLSPEAVKNAITKLIDDAEARQAYGLNGKTLAAAHSPQRMAKSICDAIDAAAIKIDKRCN